MKNYLNPKTFAIFAVLFMAVSLHTLSQAQTRVFGMLDDEEYDNQNVISIEGSGSKSMNLPEEIDLEPYCPEIGNQGNITSCVGWSVGYAALTIERAIANGWGGDKYRISSEANSAMYIYNHLKNRREACNVGGIKIVDALNFLQNHGDVLADDFDQDLANCRRQPSEDLAEVAGKYRIDDYFTIFKSKEPMAEKLRRIRLVLSKEKPVMIGMRVSESFAKLRKDEENGVSGGTWWPETGTFIPIGGHAMVVVGYDDNHFQRGSMRPKPLERRGAFKIMNSFGKEWGDKGFFWIRYDYFAKYCKYAYAMSYGGDEAVNFDEPLADSHSDARPVDGPPSDLPGDKPKQNRKKKKYRKLAGEFSFMKFTGEFVNNKPQFNEVDVEFKDNHYELKGSHYMGDYFKLFLKTGFDNGYIYVLSLDPSDVATIHFPKKESLNNKFEGKNESALLLSSGSQLSIPTGDNALKLEQTGTDYLVVLFSERKIKVKILKQLKEILVGYNETLPEEYENLFNEGILIPREEINYELDKMSFETGTRNEGSIVPLILKVNTLEK